MIIRKGRFEFKSKCIKTDISDQIDTQELNDDLLYPDNLTVAYNNDLNIETYLSIPSLDNKNSNEINPPFVGIQSKKSITEFSLRGRADAYSYQPVGNELLKTPMFTGEGSQFLHKPVPPLSFERIHEYNEMQSKEGESTIHQSLHFR